VPNSVVSEWVGIDGFPSGNNSLIQAGVDEMPYNASSFVVQPWWEILPTAETPITSMTINAGDTVTVTIDEMSSSQWTITVTDETDSQSFTTDQYYDGPQTSAEWIVEAPTEGNTQTVLAPYTPDVAFSDLQTVGNQTSMAEITMVQNDEPVSTTSTYASSGFNVAYGSTAPPAPELSKNDVTTAGHHLTAVPAPSSSMLPQIYEIGRH
jgi:hypothetical protein